MYIAMQNADSPAGTLTVTEAAFLLRVHHTTVRRWIEEGRLPAYQAKKGGAVRIARRAVDELLSSLTDGPQVAA